MKIIFLGAPGAGKGTQAELVSKKLEIPAISTGAIIRAAIKGGTDMGLKAKAYTDKGELVPDEVVIGIIKERLCEDDCKNGFILDGFPRTIPQAEAFEKEVGADVVLNFDCDNSILMDRLTGRWTCKECGAPYHKSTMGDITKCTRCGGELYQRKDDMAETVANRLNSDDVMYVEEEEND